MTDPIGNCILAGVNGAGKSTLYEALNELKGMPRINTDEIVKERVKIRITVLPFFVMVRLLGYPLFYRHGLRRKNLFVLQTCLSALVINYYKYFFITVKLRAIAVRNVLRQPLILPCSTCEAVRNFRYQRSCCRQII